MSNITADVTWSSLVPATDHGPHAKSHAFVLVHHVSKQLGGGCHWDALLVAQLVDATLAGQQALPEATVCSSSGHGTQKVGVDLNDLLHRLRGNVGACCGPRVHCDNNSMLELREATAVKIWGGSGRPHLHKFLTQKCFIKPQTRTMDTVSLTYYYRSQHPWTPH